MTDSTVSVWILLIVLQLKSVYSQERISGFSGEDILLPCSYTTSSNLNVYWRYRDTRNLIDIIDGNEDPSDQDQRFRNRIHTFPQLYAEGNFSVVLKNVSLNDAGRYNCDIPKVHYQRLLELTVRGGGGGSVSVREHTHSSLLFIMMSLILLV